MYSDKAASFKIDRGIKFESLEKAPAPKAVEITKEKKRCSKFNKLLKTRNKKHPSTKYTGLQIMGLYLLLENERSCLR